MKYDTILLSGDKKASRSVFGMNKSLIELNGTPLFIYVLSALQEVDEVDNIYIVGPKFKIEGLLDKHSDKIALKKYVAVVEQRDNLYENVWHTFLSTIKNYSDGDELKNPALMDKAVLVAAGDMPLITSFEIKEFVSKCDMESYDYCLGMIPEHILKNYYPYKGKPGIKLAYLPMRESRYRISNLHLIKPFKIINREYIEKMYEYRYQKDIRNVIKLTIELIRKHAGFKALLFYGIVEMAIFMSKIRLNIIGRFLKWLVPVESAERVVSNLLKTRLKLVETSFGGAALDVDNEKDFNVIKVMYNEWMEYQKDRRQKIEDRGERKNKLLFICFLSSIFYFLFSKNAYAWGAGLHIKEGMFVLDNLKLILPSIAELLKAFPYDYLYGCISADIFIG